MLKLVNVQLSAISHTPLTLPVRTKLKFIIYSVLTIPSSKVTADTGDKQKSSKTIHRALLQRLFQRCSLEVNIDVEFLH
jgi:hypothetical protein